MKIALVWPHGFDPKYVFPLSMGYLKSNIDSEKHNVKIIDCSLDNIPTYSQKFREILEDFDPDIIGVSCWSITYRSAIKALEVAKSINPEIITVIGGVHASAYPLFILNAEKCIDFLFRGECELSFPEFVDELEKPNPNFSQIKGLMYKDESEKIIQNVPEREPDLDKIKWPDYKAIRLQEYLTIGYKYAAISERNAPIWITRGCPYRCQYCSASIMNGKIIRKHSIQYVLNWIKYLYYEENITHITIIDDNFTFFTNYAKEFCRAFIDLGLKNLTFGTPNGIRMQRVDEELLHLMKKAGWKILFIAPESGSVRTLEKMKKDISPEIVPGIVKMIKKVGLQVHGFFILGYPDDTKEDLRATIQLLRKCDFDFFYLFNFQALPGTPIFNELVNRGEIPPDFLPKTYSGGARDYTPPDLRDINFSKLVLMEYLRFFLKSPTRVMYTMKLFSPKLIANKIFQNIINIIRSRGSEYRLSMVNKKSPNTPVRETF